MKRLRQHFLIPAASAPAPHMTSGPPRDTPGGKIGTGIPHVAACDPKIVMSDFDTGSGEAWAVGCSDCVKTEAWKKAIKDNPHPRDAKRPDEAEDVREAIKKGCGC